MAATREIELKYRVVDPAVVDVLLALPSIGPFAADPAVATIETLDRFLDTPDRAFRAVRHAVRLRTVGPRTTLTVKGPSRRGPAGAASRTELEASVEADDPDEWSASSAQAVVNSVRRGRRLEEVARIVQRRRVRLLRAGRTLVELSVDEVEVRDGDRSVAAWLEVEAELHDGDARRLRDLAAALRALGGLDPSPESKYAAALRILGRDR